MTEPATPAPEHADPEADVRESEPEQEPRPRRSAYDVGGSHAAAADPDAPAAPPRPMLERIGMAAIALVLAVMFALVGVAAFLYGEPFLGVMGLLGTLMVLWVGGMTLFRGR